MAERERLNNATRSQELFKFELIFFLKEIWPGATCVQMGKMERQMCFFY